MLLILVDGQPVLVFNDSAELRRRYLVLAESDDLDDLLTKYHATLAKDAGDRPGC